MNRLALSQVAPQMSATHLGPDASFSQVSSDTRKLPAEALFVALRGPNFDGHDYIDEARDKGAAAFMVEREIAADLPQLLVEDTRLGLGRLAAVWRNSFPVPLVAVTGSNGKTTVKEMLASILAQEGSVLATRGNLNNEIGMPLTLLRLQDESFAVLEMGANHAGEIAWLTKIARPDVAVITNAGPAHLEGFGDLAGVARAKGEIISGVTDDGVVVLNADDPQVGYWRELADSRKVVCFGLEQPADVTADYSRMTTHWHENGFTCCGEISTPHGSFTIDLQLAGRHNLTNALAATAAAQALGLSNQKIRQGLSAVAPVAGRLQSLSGCDGYRLIDDSYNANPESVRAAIDVLATAPGRRWLILGDLAELGDGGAVMLLELGMQAKRAGIDGLFTLGGISRYASQGFGEGSRHYSELPKMIEQIKQSLSAGDTLLVKGSRSAGMERVVAALAGLEAR